MIVTDSNVPAYLYLPGKYTSAAETLLGKAIQTCVRSSKKMPLVYRNYPKPIGSWWGNAGVLRLLDPQHLHPIGESRRFHAHQSRGAIRTPNVPVGVHESCNHVGFFGLAEFFFGQIVG